MFQPTVELKLTFPFSVVANYISFSKKNSWILLLQDWSSCSHFLCKFILTFGVSIMKVKQVPSPLLSSPSTPLSQWRQCKCPHCTPLLVNLLRSSSWPVPLLPTYQGYLELPEVHQSLPTKIMSCFLLFPLNPTWQGPFLSTLSPAHNWLGDRENIFCGPRE